MHFYSLVKDGRIHQKQKTYDNNVTDRQKKDKTKLSEMKWKNKKVFWDFESYVFDESCLLACLLGVFVCNLFFKSYLMYRK